jgi:hypothetical protein
MGPGFESQRDHQKASQKCEAFFVFTGFEQKRRDGFDLFHCGHVAGLHGAQ